MARPGDSYDVVVIGGGIVGNLVAYFLGRAGLNTCVVEQRFPASGTTGAAQAWVYSSLKVPPHYALMHQESVALYEQIAARHQVDFDMERCGCLWVIFNDLEEAQIAAEVAELRQAGIDVELVTARQVHHLEPVIDPGVIRGAAYGRQDGTINPFLVVRHMDRLAREMGVSYRYYTRVTAIGGDDNDFTVQTTNGPIRAQKLVIAAGVWSREIGQMIGFPIPIFPARGQILVSEPVHRRLLTRTIGNLGLRQMRTSGALLIGALQEPGEHDNHSTLAGIRSIAERAVRLAPALAGIRIIRAFSGVRPIPYDGHPLLGEIPGHPGVYSTICHSGIGLAPIIGLVTAEMITGVRPSFDISPYLIQRVTREEDPHPRSVRFR